MLSPVTNTAATVGVGSDRMGDVGDRIGMQTGGGRTALKRRALDLDTSMGELIRNVISRGCGSHGAGYGVDRARGESGGVRATLDLADAVCTERFSGWRPMRKRACKRSGGDGTSLQTLRLTGLMGL